VTRVGGWVDSYQLLLELSSDPQFNGGTVEIAVDLNDVRPVGETLKGFGGMANPVKLKDLYERVARLLNKGDWTASVFSRVLFADR
jgi:ribonucleotide reductase class II